MGFNLQEWTLRRRREQYEEQERILKESKVEISTQGEDLNFHIAFYQEDLNFYYQFIPTTSAVLDKIEQIGEESVIDELGKYIETKTGLIAPHDKDSHASGFSFKILPSELKGYMLTPFK
jgi:hypothetical protein